MSPPFGLFWVLIEMEFNFLISKFTKSTQEATKLARLRHYENWKCCKAKILKRKWCSHLLLANSQFKLNQLFQPWLWAIATSGCWRGLSSTPSSTPRWGRSWGTRTKSSWAASTTVTSKIVLRRFNFWHILTFLTNIIRKRIIK